MLADGKFVKLGESGNALALYKLKMATNENGRKAAVTGER